MLRRQPTHLPSAIAEAVVAAVAAVAVSVEDKND
jgi:hypothetical protein